MLNYCWQYMKTFWLDEEGASAVEYGLIVGLIAVAIVIVLGSVGDELFGLFTTVETELTDVNTPG